MIFVLSFCLYYTFNNYFPIPRITDGEQLRHDYQTTEIISSSTSSQPAKNVCTENARRSIK